MSLLTQKLMSRIYRSPVEDDATGGATAEDRGDDFMPDDDDVAVEAAAAETTPEEDDEPEEDPDDGEGDTEDVARDNKGRFAKKDDEPRIPKSRFDEQIQKERARAEDAERRLAALESAQKEVTRTADADKLEAEIDELTEQHAQLVLDGEVKQASAVMRDIRMKERQIAIAQSTEMSAQAKDQAREEMRIELTLERVEELYPQLNEDSDEFDQDLAEMTLSKQRSLMRSEGLSPSKALAKAAKSVMDRFGAKPAEEAPAKKLKAAQDVASRKSAQVKKNLDTAKRQAPSMNDVGEDSDKAGEDANMPNIEKMNFDDFSALPEATLARMRGDFV